MTSESAAMEYKALPPENAQLDEIVHRLIDAYQPVRIYLFGSHARGEATEDSDYDLLILVPETASEEQKRSRLAYQVLWGTGASADVLVTTVPAFERRVHLKSSLPGTVRREGVLLYDIAA